VTETAPHSVRIEEDVCIGCPACAKACPTEAIRLRRRKAVILEDRCIDCGMCMRVCPVSAAVARTDPRSTIAGYRHTIALVGPEIYSQFGDDALPEAILEAIRRVGFDEVHDVAQVCEELTVAVRHFLAAPGNKRPVISFSCPSVARLIRARFPMLLDHVLPLRSPMGAAAKRLRESRPRELGIPSEDLGLFYITPCPARMTRVRRPLTDRSVYFSGAIALQDIYREVLVHLRKVRDLPEPREPLFRATGFGVSWGASGGEVKSLLLDDCLYVDGIANVLRIFDSVERGELSELNYLEVMACAEGCAGGPLMVENPFLARNKVQKLARLFSAREVEFAEGTVQRRQQEGYYDVESDLRPRRIDPLDADPAAAIRKMRERQQILETLPGIDCGVCGAPNCRTLAEDIVFRRAEKTDCVFVLFDQAGELVRRVNEWTSKLPVTIRRPDPSSNVAR
jgi:Fe-S-cluster-containing hydrogenase component 2